MGGGAAARVEPGSAAGRGSERPWHAATSSLWITAVAGGRRRAIVRRRLVLSAPWAIEVAAEWKEKGARGR